MNSNNFIKIQLFKQKKIKLVKITLKINKITRKYA